VQAEGTPLEGWGFRLITSVFLSVALLVAGGLGAFTAWGRRNLGSERGGDWVALDVAGTSAVW
jgi:hypothetical protein